MKNIRLLIALIPVFSFAQNEKNPCETLSKINTIIQAYHYKPKPVDDSLSVYVFDTFLDKLDSDHNLFTEPEIDLLKKHKYKLDDYILNNNCSFLDELYVSYNKSIERYVKLVIDIQNQPFPSGTNEIIQFSKKPFPFLKDETELKKLYAKKILFHILKDIAETSQNKDSLTANFEPLFSKSKLKIFEHYECAVANYRLTRTEFNTKFFSVFCSYFDPHTEYFSEGEKSLFLASISADNLTFGLNLSTNEKNEITVEEVIPGSSAFFSEKINEGDSLLTIKAKNEEYNIACSSMEKINEIVSSSDYKIADFTLRKKSGEIYTVSLEKRVMKDYQNSVYSYILENDNKKTGYLKIPSFYAIMENGKTNVSDDVVKEIYKLKKDNIEGLIIDLENNGGGSLEETIKLLGQFIDVGPLAIINNRNNKKETIKDYNRGTIYSGPIVVLINGLSASASEFFTNAMQDYNRAVVVGNQSYGKATMQRFIPLTYEESPSEFIKLTLEKFYRITGKSNQYTGTTPDVVIPSLFDKQMPHESSNSTALKNDEITSTLKYHIPTNNNSQAIELSKKRMESNPDVAALKNLNVKIDALYDNDLPPIPMQFVKVFDEVNRINNIWKEIESISEKEYPINVERNTVDIEYQQFDEFLKTSNKEKIKMLKTNIHIFEAVNIINDLKK